ncbi:hypothetical protein [Streptomyces sp. NPDC059080]|uniref:hypothetical protein n=1 Tax=Streptomyces sp. NPDC059080 TaxID=3346718 RepID=UPI0036A15AD6
MTTRLVYTVEDFDSTPGTTFGFFNITTADPEQFAPLARQLCTAVGPKRGGLDYTLLFTRKEKSTSVIQMAAS